MRWPLSGSFSLSWPEGMQALRMLSRKWSSENSSVSVQWCDTCTPLHRAQQHISMNVMPLVRKSSSSGRQQLSCPSTKGPIGVIPLGVTSTLAIATQEMMLSLFASEATSRTHMQLVTRPAIAGTPVVRWQQQVGAPERSAPVAPVDVLAALLHSPRTVQWIARHSGHGPMAWPTQMAHL